MYHERLITGVAATLAALAVLLTVAGFLGSPAAFPVALAFAAAAVLMYDQLSGRMAARVYRRVERRARVDGGRDARDQTRRRPGAAGDRVGVGGFGAGPRERWGDPRGGGTGREAAAAGRRVGARSRPSAGPSPADRAAYETLGVDPGADEETIRSAYRALVKEAHPDAPEGSRERFKAVNQAYEQLTE